VYDVEIIDIAGLLVRHLLDERVVGKDGCFLRFFDSGSVAADASADEDSIIDDGDFTRSLMFRALSESVPAASGRAVIVNIYSDASYLDSQ
jgi:hypothetical protein